LEKNFKQFSILLLPIKIKTSGFQSRFLEVDFQNYKNPGYFYLFLNLNLSPFVEEPEASL
jgi:hypothetical protein